MVEFQGAFHYARPTHQRTVGLTKSNLAYWRKTLTIFYSFPQSTTLKIYWREVEINNRFITWNGKFWSGQFKWTSYRSCDPNYSGGTDPKRTFLFEFPPKFLACLILGKAFSSHSLRCNQRRFSYSFFLYTCFSFKYNSFFLAGSVSGQMSVIRSVCVPPATLPESSLSVQRQPPSQFIKKWKPFGYSRFLLF